MKKTAGTIKTLVSSLILLALISLTFGLYSAFARPAKADEYAREYVLDGIIPEDEQGNYSSPDEYMYAVWQNEIDSFTGLNETVKVTMETDWTVNGSVQVSANSRIVLNLNGHTITGTGAESVFVVRGELDLYDDVQSGEDQPAVGTVTGGNSEYGGGISVRDGKFTMYGGAVSGNEADYGGGVSVLGGSFAMYGGTVSGNNALIYGGGVSVRDGTFTMYGGTINNNTANEGGGVYSGSALSLYGGTVSENEANESGGGIFAKGTVRISDGESEAQIYKNSAAYGGGIYFDGSALTLSGGYIYANTATQSGGGICSGYTNTESVLNLNGGTIGNVENGNTANEGGGVWSGGSLYISGGTVIGNTANEGGGVYSSGDVFNMSGGSVSGNTATQSGGGIYTLAFEMSGGTVDGNTAQNRGGGIYSGGEFYLTGGTIEGNSADYRGGGIYSGHILYISKAFTVTGNDNGSGAANNVYLPAGNRIIINGNLEGSSIGITLDNDYNGAFTDGYFEYHNSGNLYPDGPDEYFLSDAGQYTAISDETDTDGVKKLEVKLVSEQIVWELRINSGNYEQAEGCGITLTYGKEVTGIRVNGEVIYNNSVHDYAEVGEYTVRYKDTYVFFIVVTPADISGVISIGFSDERIKQTNNKSEYVVVYSEDLFDWEGAFIQPEITVGDALLDETLLVGRDYELSMSYSSTDGKAQFEINGINNYEGKYLFTLFVIESEQEYVDYVTHYWQYFIDGEWRETSGFVYSAADMKEYVRIIVQFKRITTDNPEGDIFEEIITVGTVSDDWTLSLFGSGGVEAEEFRLAGSYTFELEGYNRGETITDEVVLEIGQAESFDSTLLSGSFGRDNDSWLVFVGAENENKTVTLLGAEALFLTENGATYGEAGQAYVYVRGTKTAPSALSVSLNVNTGAGAYIYGVDGNYLSLRYETVTLQDDGYAEKLKTTATVTFDNYYFTIGGERTSSITIEKEWYAVTACNELFTFSETASDYDKVTENLGFEWEYGDLHDNGIFSYVFRPAHGEYAFYTISGNGVNERFAVRFTDNVTSFWQYSGEYEVGNRILDKFFLYNYLEELKSGSYKISLHIPENSTSATYKQWWNGNGEFNDYGVIYAEMSFEFTVEVKAYVLAEAISLEHRNGYYSYTDGKLELRYASEIPYDVNNMLPEVTLVLKGRTMTENDYTVTAVGAQTDNNMLRAFIISAVEGGNLSGEILGVAESSQEGLPYEITALSNSFETLSIIAWKYGAFDGSINSITAKATAGKVTLYVHSNNSTRVDDDTVIDNIDEVLISLGEVIVDGNGIVNITPAMISRLEELGAGTYWLRAVAADEDGIYKTCESQVKFVILRAENRWSVLPGVVSWSYGSFNPAENRIYGTPVYGNAVFAVYRLNSDKTYTPLEFGGKTEFTLMDGETPEEVIEELSKLDSGTYYICASVAGSDNYTGLNENYTVEDVSRFPSFSVISLNNSWQILPAVVSWSYGGYSPEINIITGAPAFGEAVFEITDKDGVQLVFDGKTTFTLTDGVVPEVVREVLEGLNSGIYYLHAHVEGTVNFTELDVSLSFTVAKYENFWTETPNLPGWKWGEYSEAFNVITASSASLEAPVVFRIAYTRNGEVKNLTFDGKTAFTFEDGKLPGYVRSVLEDLTAGITYTLYASVAETDNYTGLEEVYTTFEVIRQTNYWKISPNAVSWKYGEYDEIVNVISATPAYGEASITVYRNNNGIFEEVDTDDMRSLDTGVYYVCAVVVGCDNYTGLNDGNVDYAHLPSFSVIGVNNYWRITPGIADWKWGEYDESVNVITATPAYGEAEFSIYAPDGNGYSLLKINGKTTFKLADGNVPEDVKNALKALNSGTYYLRAYVEGTVNYTGLNETVDLTRFAQFNVYTATNYWLVTPNMVSWRYGEYDGAVNVIAAAPAYGEASVTVYRAENGAFRAVDLDAVGIENLPAGTYYLCATVRGTANYTGINENITESDISSLATFSVVKVNNQWEDVPALLGWSENNFDPTVNAITGRAKHGEVVFTITDEHGNEIDITQLGKLGVGSYYLNAYVAETDSYYELKASTTFAVFEDSVGMTRIIIPTVIFAVLAVGLAVTAIFMLIRRNKKIEQEFLMTVKSEINNG